MSQAKLQFTYTFSRFDAQGRLAEVDQFTNLIPTLGRDYMLDVLFGAGTRLPGFFVGLIGAAGYTPAATDTPAYLAVNAAEVVAYGTVRPAFDGAINQGVWSNSLAPASMTFTAPVTVYGGFLQSNSAFNSATGLLLSAAKAASPRTYAAGESLQVVTAISLLV